MGGSWGARQARGWGLGRQRGFSRTEPSDDKPAFLPSASFPPVLSLHSFPGGVGEGQSHLRTKARRALNVGSGHSGSGPGFCCPLRVTVGGSYRFSVPPLYNAGRHTNVLEAHPVSRSHLIEAEKMPRDGFPWDADPQTGDGVPQHMPRSRERRGVTESPGEFRGWLLGGTVICISGFLFMILGRSCSSV